jgi:SAM-dependent methyltransferase
VQKDFYSEYYAVEDKHWWFVGRRRVLLCLLDRYFGRRLSEGRSLLDVGCGTGTMLGYLSRYGAVRGVDADEAAISFCRQRGVDNVQLYDGRKLPFRDQTFDLVTMFDVLEHIEDDRFALEEVFRVLKAGGTFILTVPAYPFLWGPQDEVSLHKRRYLASELRLRICSSGFNLVKLSYFNSILFPPIAAIRLGRRIIPAPRGEQQGLRSDFSFTTSGWVNSALAWIFGIEQFIVPRIRIPFGVSIVGVAKRTT